MPGIEELLGRVSYDGIPVFGKPPEPAAGARPPFDFAGGERGMTFKSLGPGTVRAASLGATKGPKPAARGPRPVSRRGATRGGPRPAARGAPEHYGDGLKGIVFEDSDLEVLSLSADKAEVSAASVETKPSEVTALEKVLSLAYDNSIQITAINELETTRKQVKEVHFMKARDSWLYKVWVFKADPVATAKELAVYYIADKQGVPTGRPIGFKPTEDQEKYPFDIAILGGAMVEHAGDPYNKLLNNMRFTPERIHGVAEAVAKMLAECHVRLTKAKEEFKKYGVELEKADPEKEIRERFLAGSYIGDIDGSGLIRACKELYNQQSNIVVVSHCDTHTGNLVTKERGGYSTNMSEFGIIDWGSVALDNPQGDLRDFWLHHQRQASKTCTTYDFGFESLDDAYKVQFQVSARRHGLAIEIDNSQRDSLIQSALWNLYEMYDPTRTVLKDIQEKARTHCQALMSDLEKLQMFGLGEQANAVKREVRALLHYKEYLKPILDS
jgi:thiamine kinase-like enzyme